MKKRKTKSKKTKNITLNTIILALLAALIHFGAAIYEELRPVEMPSSEEPVKIYANQINDNLKKVYLDSIDKANYSISMVIYSLLDKDIIQKLSQKAQEGVDVHVVCDAKASLGIGRKLKNATLVKRTSKGLCHQKILVIDEKLIYLGSANMTSDSLKVHGNLVLGLDHEDLGRYLSARIKSMDDEGGHTPSLQQFTKADGQTVEVWNLPDNSKQGLERIKQLLRSAQKTIRVAMFTFTRADLAQELIQASLRGIKVETVIDRYSASGASKKVANLLSSSNLFTHINTSQGLLHYKMAYIDGEILINGSTNWTTAAFKDNDDFFMVIYPLTKPQARKLDGLWSAICHESEAI